ncbi:hypothetical protein ACFRKB_09315 [Streptomyces scopuliridis]|uniref:hypothetical protein n=1 Tax=Streptomyces scopuliridis TaxID=452529 RepID=UPI00369B77AA
MEQGERALVAVFAGTFVLTEEDQFLLAGQLADQALRLALEELVVLGVEDECRAGDAVGDTGQRVPADALDARRE